MIHWFYKKQDYQNAFRHVNELARKFLIDKNIKALKILLKTYDDEDAKIMESKNW
jgi:hypothetical protein